MVSLDKEVARILKTIPGADVKTQFPKSSAKLPRITYYEAGNVPGVTADDSEYASRIAMGIDVWSKTMDEVNAVALLVDKAMSENRYRRAMCHGITDPVTGLARKVMRFEKLA